VIMTYLHSFSVSTWKVKLIDEDHVLECEQTIVGYRNITVNDSDEERNKVCEEKFKSKFPNITYVERDIIVVTTE
jgi:hypothetical protein